MTQFQPSQKQSAEPEIETTERFVQSVMCFIPVTVKVGNKVVTKVLIAQIPEDNTEGGKWNLFGGKVDPNDNHRQSISTLKSATIRELHEELGVEVQPDSLELAKLITSKEDPTKRGKLWSIYYFVCRIDFSSKLIDQQEMLRLIRLQSVLKKDEVSEIALIGEEEILSGEYPIAFDQQEKTILGLLKDFNEA